MATNGTTLLLKNGTILVELHGEREREIIDKLNTIQHADFDKVATSEFVFYSHMKQMYSYNYLSFGLKLQECPTRP